MEQAEAVGLSQTAYSFIEMCRSVIFSMAGLVAYEP